MLAGDGTLNEAADGLAGLPHTGTLLAPLPGGSTNVFARTIGVAYDPVRASEQLVDSLVRGSWRRIGIGAVGGRRFLFHLGLGFDAAVVRRVDQVAYLKRHLAHPAFAVAGVETWFRYDKATTITIEAYDADGTLRETAAGPYAVVSNSSPYTYAGRRPIVLAPEASLDGPLSVTALRTLRLPVALRTVMSGLARHRYVTSTSDIAQGSQICSLRAVGDRPFPWQVDGEYLGESEQLDVSYEADALGLVLP